MFPQLWTPQNIIIFNLALSDFAVSIFGNPVTLAAAISKGWIFGETICVMYGFFMALLGNKNHLYLIYLKMILICWYLNLLFYSHNCLFMKKTIIFQTKKWLLKKRKILQDFYV